MYWHQTSPGSPGALLQDCGKRCREPGSVYGWYLLVSGAARHLGTHSSHQRDVCSMHYVNKWIRRGAFTQTGARQSARNDRCFRLARGMPVQLLRARKDAPVRTVLSCPLANALATAIHKLLNQLCSDRTKWAMSRRRRCWLCAINVFVTSPRDIGDVGAQHSGWLPS